MAKAGRSPWCGSERRVGRKAGGVCDTVIFKVFGLYPQFPAHSSPNLWHFLSVENNKGVFWVPPKGGVWLSGKPTMWLEVWFQSSPCPFYLASGERLEFSLVNHNHRMKPPWRASMLRNKNASMSYWAPTSTEALLFMASPYVSLHLAVDLSPLISFLMNHLVSKRFFFELCEPF